MKLLFVILLAFGCGKTDTKNKYYQVSEESLSQDSDGDGTLDWDEIHAGKDPYQAEAPVQFRELHQRVTLIDQDHRELELKAEVQRTLRTAVLREFVTGTPNDLPIVNEQRISVNESKEFWSEALNDASFIKIRLRDSSGNEKIFRLDEDFNKKGIHYLNEDLGIESLKRIQSKTYRLILSFSDKDYVYHLHPSVSPIEFLKKRHQLSLDNDRQVNMVDNLAQQVSHPVNLDASDETAYWISSDCIRENQARAGQTCYIAYTTLHELKQAIKQQPRFAFDLPFQVHNRLGHSSKLLVVAQGFEQLNWQVSQDSISWDIGSGDRSREVTCTFRMNQKPRYSSAIGDKEFLLNSFQYSGMSEMQVSWFTHGARGSAMLINLYTLPVQNSLIQSQDLQKTIPIGTFQSGCPKKVPVNVTHYQLYKNLKMEFYWIRETL